MYRIQSDQLSRQFEIVDGHFKTISFLNHLTNKEITNESPDEFKVYLVNGNVVRSSQLQAKVSERPDGLSVNFSNEHIEIEVNYQAKNNQLSKVLRVISCLERINYIDVEVIEFKDSAHIYPIKPQKDVKEMADFSGYYMEMGQPVYAKSLFFGMEFPMAENRVSDRLYFSRYYYGQAVTDEPLVIWPVISGAAEGFSEVDIQKSFFTYIREIAQPNDYRLQYNSWYDFMLDIDNENIIDSFKEINRGFSDYGLSLDTLVVDDGWPNYESVWEFNHKFPNELEEIAAEVKKIGATLGLWIGPRGGYGGTQKVMSDWLEAHPELEIGSKNKISEDVNVGDFNYLREMKKQMLKHQKNYDISYWKIDGWLLKPDVPDESGDYAMHTMTSVYEFLVEMLTDLRVASGREDYWINLTSYVNPSPWFLKWVNSLWLQNSEDIGFVENGGNVINQMMSYRDSQYFEFTQERGIRLPLWSFYNHEPIYAKTAHRYYFDEPIYADVDDFEKYLFWHFMRGNGLWEFYYSYEMFDDKRWAANAKAVKWAMKNYHILKHSQLFGPKASDFGIYGYICDDKELDEYLIGFRNSSSEKRTVTCEIDSSAIHFEYGSGEFSDQDGQLIVTLKPYEVLILKAKK